MMVVMTTMSEQCLVSCMRYLFGEGLGLEEVAFKGTLKLQLLNVAEKDVVELPTLLRFLALLCLLLLDHEGSILKNVD